ncbi:MAG: T9SS type A sorting domain-containing protein [Bacteroidia bacterium]|nr:T9SS type A sorting domain-containing protein [Bacteroidia bacterium]
MKLQAHLVLLVFFTASAEAQNLNMTFTGTGASTHVESVTATNLTTSQSVTLPGNGTLVLTTGNGIPPGSVLEDQDLVFPNPFSRQATFSTSVKQAQSVTLKIQNFSGQDIAAFHGIVGSGQQGFAIRLKTPGIYSISLTTGRGTFSQKMICMDGQNQENCIQHLGPISDNQDHQNHSAKPELKGLQTLYSLGFTAGDVIYYKCSNGEHTTIRTDSPVSSVNYQIEFVECADDDGNYYPVVNIGRQTWMAGNLAFLPMVNPSTQGSENTPYLYVYNYQGTDTGSARENDNFSNYGVLYNWPAALIACPSGWHLPSDQEWDWLTNFSQASELSGFEALPGGVRQTDGNFGSLGKYTGFWSSADIGLSDAWSRHLDFENDLTNSIVEKKSTGFSVRCVRNQAISETLPTVNTYPVTGITSFSAEGSGNLISNHAESATDRGICWSTNRNPTLSDGKASAGNGLGVFTVTLSGLTANTTYYLRAFATNSAGTGYGAELSFTTLEGGTFTDSRDSKTYHYVKIGDQFWMAENLAYLPAVSRPATLSALDPHNYVYGYDGTSVATAETTANYSTYGVLYNRAAALSACPAGWHLPTNAEFTRLTNYVGGEAIAGFKMKSLRGWNDNAGANGNGDNAFGFTALPGGDIEGTGIFLNVGNYGSFWTSDPDGASNGWMWLLDNFNAGAFLHSYPRSIGVSVRCLKNQAE